MTFAKILILVILVSVFAYTLYKLIMQIREYKQKKASAQQDSNSNVNSYKEDK